MSVPCAGEILQRGKDFVFFLRPGRASIPSSSEHLDAFLWRGAAIPVSAHRRRLCAPGDRAAAQFLCCDSGRPALVASTRFSASQLPRKSGNQHFHLAAGNAIANLFDRTRKKSSRRHRGLIIAIDARDDGRSANPSAPTASATRKRLFFVRRAGGFCRSVQRKIRQARVQMSPRIMKVAVPWSQHSPMFGQRALSQTVCRSSVRMMRFEILVALAAEEFYAEPVGPRVHPRRWNGNLRCARDDVER